MTPPLHDCLSQAPYAVLLRIGKHYAVPLGHDRHRANVLERLLAAPLEQLVRREIARITLSALLSPLEVLAGAGGDCERIAFERAFGPCQVPRAGALDPGQAGVWLGARGLIFALSDRVIVPAELISSLPRPHDSERPLALAQEHPATPLYDLSILLVVARRGALTVDRRHGQLTLRALAGLRPLCSSTASDDSLRFLARDPGGDGYMVAARRAVSRAHREPGPHQAGFVKSRPGSAGARCAARPSQTGHGDGREARAPRVRVFPPLVLTFHEPCPIRLSSAQTSSNRACSWRWCDIGPAS